MRRAIAWFAENHVAANLLMGLILLSGGMALYVIPQKAFPDVEIDFITVSVPYLGAAPEEVEQGVCLRIEEQLQDISGIEVLRSSAAEGACAVTAELFDDADVATVLDEVKNRVDSISTFPDETEQPVIAQVTSRRIVMELALTGTDDERVLKELGQRVREDLAALPEITQVELANVRPYEISIEVSEKSLRRHGLTFRQVADAVRRSSLDLPGGAIKTAGGEILLRTQAQAYRGPEFERLIVLTRPDGSRVLLSDVATVVDGFQDTDQAVRFNGEPAAMLRVYRVGEQDLIEIARAVQRYVEAAPERLPEGIELTIWQDGSTMLRDRLDTLIHSGRIGFLLVFTLLALLLRPRVSFWVSLGIPISMLGALAVIGLVGLSVDAISLFGFILVLGILVDDGIIVGENVHTHQQSGQDRLGASISAAQEVFTPVVFGVLTTVVAFSPLLMVPGMMGQIMAVISAVVIACLIFSLIESLLILPAHLGHGRERGSSAEVTLLLIPILLLVLSGVSPDSRTFFALALSAAMGLLLLHRVGIMRRFADGLIGVQTRIADALDRFTRERFLGWLDRALLWRYTTVAVALALLLCTLSVIGSGRMRFSFFPPLEADTVSAQLTMPQGVPVSVTEEAVRRITSVLPQLRAEFDPVYAEPGESIVEHVLAAVGGRPVSDSGGGGPQSALSGGGVSDSHLGEVTLQLVPSQERDISTRAVADRWRDLVGPIPGAVELVYDSALFRVGDAINIKLQGRNVDQLREAAARIRAKLAEYPGVVDISDSFRAGKRELKLSILPSGESLGLTLEDVARQVRRAFYGEEAQRIQRGVDDVRVMVRYTEEERRSLGTLEDMRIRTPSGAEVPFSSVARAELGRGYSTIRRTDRQRVVNVTADVDRTQITENEVVSDLLSNAVPEILGDFPGISYGLEGMQEEQAEGLRALVALFGLALFGIYALLAIPLRSYSQPLLIMAVIPFALIGAIAGHLLMGKGLAMMSVQGFVAASGVVVNDSLILVHFVNQRRKRGVALRQAVREAGVARFRPILLTSLTTFAGLSPLMLNRSVQAQFLVPMAISLSFGVLFATAITLLVVPSGYLILEDLRRRFGGRRADAGDSESLSHPDQEPAPEPLAASVTGSAGVASAAPHFEDR